MDNLQQCELELYQVFEKHPSTGIAIYRGVADYTSEEIKDALKQNENLVFKFWFKASK